MIKVKVGQTWKHLQSNKHMRELCKWGAEPGKVKAPSATPHYQVNILFYILWAKNNIGKERGEEGRGSRGREGERERERGHGQREERRRVNALVFYQEGKNFPQTKGFCIKTVS